MIVSFFSIQTLLTILSHSRLRVGENFQLANVKKMKKLGLCFFGSFVWKLYLNMKEKHLNQSINGNWMSCNDVTGVLKFFPISMSNFHEAIFTYMRHHLLVAFNSMTSFVYNPFSLK